MGSPGDLELMGNGSAIEGSRIDIDHQLRVLASTPEKGTTGSYVNIALAVAFPKSTKEPLSFPIFLSHRKRLQAEVTGSACRFYLGESWATGFPRRPRFPCWFV